MNGILSDKETNFLILWQFFDFLDFSLYIFGLC